MRCGKKLNIALPRDKQKKRSCTTNTKIWQLRQSSARKSQNLETDFTEATEKAQELGWSEGTHAPECWLELNDVNDS